MTPHIVVAEEKGPEGRKVRYVGPFPSQEAAHAWMYEHRATYSSSARALDLP